MNPIARTAAIAGAAFALQGCLAKTAVDLATTSQSEADEKRGRELRKREEELGKLQRKYDRQLKDCQDGDRNACSAAQATYDQIQVLLPTVPVDPER